ncbi:unnamed protein product [Umbelopsis vinacea]
MAGKKQKSQISTDYPSQEKHDSQNKGSKPAKELKAFIKSGRKAGEAGDSNTGPAKKDAKLKQKHQKLLPQEPKSGKRKQDMFFAPPAPMKEAEEVTKKEEEQPKVTEPSQPESEAVIETIKIPVATPDPATSAQQNLAARSGVVSVVNKAHKKRKRSNIDVVAELEKDARKLIRTGNSLGAGLEVDGWD